MILGDNLMSMVVDWLTVVDVGQQLPKVMGDNPGALLAGKQSKVLEVGHSDSFGCFHI